MYCMNCGEKLKDGAKFCPNCGTSVSVLSGGVYSAEEFEENAAEVQSGRGDKHYAAPVPETDYRYAENDADGSGDYDFSGNNGDVPAMKERNIALCIIFSIITCGIYYLYWMVVLNDDSGVLAEEEKVTSGGLVLLFSIITCGIYQLYWLYKLGQRVDKIKGNENGYTGIIYLVLSVFGMGIIAYALAQDAINTTVQA